MLVVERQKKPWDLEDVREHVSQQMDSQTVTAVDGAVIELPVKNFPISICCHSDSPGFVDIIRTTREVIDRFNQENGR
jgi:lactam utilization protein B